jgi:hypothetical protein
MGGHTEPTPTQPQHLLWLASRRFARPARAFLVGRSSITEPSTALQRSGQQRTVSSEVFSCTVSDILTVCCSWFPVSSRDNGHVRDTNEDHLLHGPLL